MEPISKKSVRPNLSISDKVIKHIFYKVKSLLEISAFATIGKFIMSFGSAVHDYHSIRISWFYFILFACRPVSS